MKPHPHAFESDSRGPIVPSLPAVQDHSRQFPQYELVYPVISRRSRGLSLGVNLNPDKVCNFDCIYCEVDRSTPGRGRTVDPAQLREELSRLIESIRLGKLSSDTRFRPIPHLLDEIRDIAFSGDGEPTLAENFSECVGIVAEVKRAQGLSTTKIVLITDAAGLDKADVRNGLLTLDANQGEIWAKLDAGSEAYFRMVNRSNVSFERILANLLEAARRRPIVIQTMLLNVNGERMSPPEVQRYCERISELTRAGAQIKEIHAYTVARPTPEHFAAALTPIELNELAETIRQKTGLTVAVFP